MVFIRDSTFTLSRIDANGRIKTDIGTLCTTAMCLLWIDESWSIDIFKRLFSSRNQLLGKMKVGQLA